MVWSRQQETIVIPSGEKANDMISRLCALVFSLWSSSVAVWRATRFRFEGNNGFGFNAHPNSRL